MDLSKMINDAITSSEIDVECPNCKKEFSIEVNQIGNVVRCPHCETDIELKDNF